MNMALTCASNFECWTFVAEAIANRSAAAELRWKLRTDGYCECWNHLEKNAFGVCRALCSRAWLCPLHPGFAFNFGGLRYWGP